MASAFAIVCCFSLWRLSNGRSEGRYPTLHFVLESGHKNAGDALRIFNETKAELKAKGCDMFGDLLFADKDESDPLMMADFLAHTTFMMHERTPSPDAHA